MSDLKDYLKSHLELVDDALNNFLPKVSVTPRTIHQAMRYSVFAGGKRLRPILTLAAAEACGGRTEDALAPACSVEMMHTYSLVHDDLPGMDNDDLRRGRPTSHKVYGEGMAVLAGDALLTEAFITLASTPPTERYSLKEILLEFAVCGGSEKLIGGQVLDLEGEDQDLTQEELVQIHENKTAALLTTSLRLGGMSANATPEQLTALTDFGYNLGLAFQVIDDILDVTQSTEKLGKTAGKDEAANKATYPSILGLEESKAEAKRLTGKALAALETFGDNGKTLEAIAHYLLDREF
ncbi:farnesyl diphosphate synthase [Verrucomicrobiaceae bacterium 227]